MTLRESLAPNKSNQFKFNSFFTGIGGFDLGFEQAGISPAYHCEIDKFCNSVLCRHWDKLPRAKDVKTVNANELPETEVWCGGFPCQDVSVARGWLGREGLRGKHSGLFYPFFDLVKIRTPQVVVIENVTGLLNSHDGQDFRIILQSFNNLGYAVAWRVMNTQYFGVPQSRPRVFMCAWLGNPQSACYALYEPSGAAFPENQRQGFLIADACPQTGAVVSRVAYCLAATSGRHTGTDWSRSYVSYHDKVRRLTPAEYERLQGFPTGWTLPEDSFPGSEDEIDTLRYQALGNAVSVPVVQWIGERITELLLSVPTLPSKEVATDFKVFQALTDLLPEFRHSKAMFVKLAELETEGKAIKWKTGGCAYRGVCVTFNVSPAPAKPVPSRFIDIIEKQEVNSRYYLSPNAAEGILRRVDKNERQLFQPLREALERLANRETLKSSSVTNPVSSTHKSVLLVNRE
jgi:DNA (cytosine-5)-methyltransferase 1